MSLCALALCVAMHAPSTATTLVLPGVDMTALHHANDAEPTFVGAAIAVVGMVTAVSNGVAAVFNCANNPQCIQVIDRWKGDLRAFGR